MHIPEINKKNFQKVLRELKEAEFPSINNNLYLKAIKQKLENKIKLTFSEEQISFHKLKAYFEECRKEINSYFVKQIDFSKFSQRPPLDFQEDGIRFLLNNDRCILGDDPGLGKSIQSVIASLCLQEDYKILVVTLRTLKYNFQKEISFFSESYKVIEKKWESDYKFTIVHYEQLKKYKKEIIKENFNCIISDESHCVSNSKTLRSKNLEEIITKTSKLKKLWLLTGTPMTNRPFNYFNLLKLIKHPLSKNWRTFVERYCEGYQDHFKRWVTDGASNLEELYDKTKDSILRRLKKDHLKDLPNKNRKSILLHLENRKGYQKVIEDYKKKKFETLYDDLSDDEIASINNLDEDDIKVGTMTKLILWRQFCALEKIEDGSLLELVNNQVEQGNKVVVFTNFTAVVDAVYKGIGDDKCRIIDGRIKSPEERLKIVDEFNNNPDLIVLACNLKVGGTGLNIQSANVMIMNDMSWVPGEMLQGEDRLWRMGQLKEVLALYPIYEGTVEEVVFNTIEKKMRNISTVIEGKEESYFLDNSIKNSNSTKLTQKDLILQEIFAQLN